jgi:hypothetical protein
MSSQYYGGAIWTNHALKRLDERGLSQDMASAAFNSPDNSSPGRERDTTLSQKKFGNSLVSVISKQNESREWIILSCWIDPPLPGSSDDKRQNAYRSYQKSSPMQKVWITIKRQLGLSKY